MNFWYTLAHSKIGTHRMKFNTLTEKAEAENIGKNYCIENNLEYIGTYDSKGINNAETNFRISNYSTLRPNY